MEARIEVLNASSESESESDDKFSPELANKHKHFDPASDVAAVLFESNSSHKHEHFYANPQVSSSVQRVANALGQMLFK